jgi:DNA-binding Lrp family transcriptional regulator
MNFINTIREAVSGLFHREQTPAVSSKPRGPHRLEVDGKRLWQMHRSGMSFEQIGNKLNISDSTAQRRLREWEAEHQSEIKKLERLDLVVGAFVGIALGMRARVEPIVQAPIVVTATPEPNPQPISPITDEDIKTAALRASGGLDQADRHLALSRKRDEGATPALESATVDRAQVAWFTFDSMVFDLARGRYPITLVREWTSALSKQFRGAKELWLIVPELESSHDTVSAPAPLRDSLNRLLNSMPGDVRAKIRQYDFRHIPIPAPEQTDFDTRIARKVDVYAASGMTQENAGRIVLAEYKTAIQPWRGQEQPKGNESPDRNDGSSACY